ncbi:MAG TPA: hypothetical protein VGN12_17950 [Pirellulales bacterium]
MNRLSSMWYWHAIVFLAVGCVSTEGRAVEVIDFVDVYGLRTLSREAVLAAAGVKPGDNVPVASEEIVRKLEALPGVARAAVAVIHAPAMPSSGKTIVVVYLGVDESPEPRATYKPAPRGEFVLPDALVATYEDFERSLAASMNRGDYGEDDSNGYALVGDEASRTIQKQFVPLAEQHFDQLIKVLQNAESERQRAIAAWVIGYASDKRRVAAELTGAVRDSEKTVRNNAMRGLAIIIGFAQHHPELKLDVSCDTFIDMLDSVKWTDRNKAMAVLNALIETDMNTLAELRERALPGLAEMARWHYEGHATQAFFILAKVAGLNEEQMVEAWRAGKRDEVIARALARTDVQR